MLLSTHLLRSTACQGLGGLGIRWTAEQTETQPPQEAQVPGPTAKVTPEQRPEAAEGQPGHTATGQRDFGQNYEVETRKECLGEVKTGPRATL